MKIVVMKILTSRRFDKLKLLIKEIKDQLLVYYEHLILCMAFKIKFEILEKRMKTQENVLSLEKLVRKWKMGFSDEGIQELKKYYGINAEINSFNYQIIKDKKKLI